MMSFILIGVGKRTRRDLGEVSQPLPCLRCNNHIAYHHIHVRTWLTGFFVRVYSYRSEHILECPICHHGIRLQGAEVEAAKQGTLKVYMADTES